MALRPIDNALPTTTPERPKKQPKIAVATQKQQDRASVNGENVVPLPSSEDATVDYVSSDNLKPLADPEVKIQVCACFYFCSLAPLKKITSFRSMENSEIAKIFGNAEFGGRFGFEKLDQGL